jgi:hypothetical protein
VNEKTNERNREATINRHDLSVAAGNAEAVNMESERIFRKFGATSENSRSSGIGDALSR